VQNGSPRFTESKKYISRPIPAELPDESARYCIYIYRPIWPEIWQVSAGIHNLWVLWTQETHFAPSNTYITHFATILGSFEDLENFKISPHLILVSFSKLAWYKFCFFEILRPVFVKIFWNFFWQNLRTFLMPPQICMVFWRVCVNIELLKFKNAICASYGRSL